MSFISNYLNHLRVSDEPTKHRAALTIAVIASVIVLSILFLIFKNRFLSYGNRDAVVETKTATDSIESPMTSFSKFISESGSQLSSIKSTFSSITGKKDDKQQKNDIGTATTTDNASTSINSASSTTN